MLMRYGHFKNNPADVAASIRAKAVEDDIDDPFVRKFVRQMRLKGTPTGSISSKHLPGG
jgi:hypothetical protein